MPFISLSRTDLSDLVYHELDPSVGYARQDIVVNAPAVGGQPATLKMGTVVFRVKSADTMAPYAPVTSDSQVVLANEFAVVFGDNYGCKESWTVGAADTTYNSVGFVSGPLFLKDALIIETTGFDRDSADYNALKQVLQNQGIVLEHTL